MEKIPAKDNGPEVEIITQSELIVRTVLRAWFGDESGFCKSTAAFKKAVKAVNDMNLNK
jgi:hypothetical protein